MTRKKTEVQRAKSSPSRVDRASELRPQTPASASMLAEHGNVGANAHDSDVNSDWCLSERLSPFDLRLSKNRLKLWKESKMPSKSPKRRKAVQASCVDVPMENVSINAAPPDGLAAGTNIAPGEWDAVFRSGSVKAYVYLPGQNGKEYIIIEPGARLQWMDLPDLQIVAQRADEFFDQNILFALRSDFAQQSG
jgi:hypothetical protein